MSLLSSKTIAVIGGGSVGSILANALQGKAKSVVIAARNPEKTKAQLADKGLDYLPVESLASAISSADIVILATPSVHSDESLRELAHSLGDDVSNKVVMDATNPLSDFSDGLQVRWTQGTSGGEVLQEALPNSFVYKAFNTLGVEHMADPTGKDMLFCGSPDQRELAQAVVEAVGYKPYYVGPIRYARNLEAMAELWIHCAIPPLPAANLGRDWTFGVSGNPSSS